MYLPNLKFVTLPIPAIIGGTQKIWAIPGYFHAPFSPKIFMGFCSRGPMNVPAKFAVVPEIIAIAVLDWGLRTPNLGEDAGGRGWYRSKELW